MSTSSEDLRIRYELNQWPPPAATAVIGLQWLVVLMPGLLVLGEIVASAQGLNALERVAFFQRLLLLMSLTQVAQVLAGHRLPGLVGPSAALMVGVLATLASGVGAVYGALAVGGGLCAILGLTGMAAHLRKLYTPPVLASTLMLIAMTLTPTMRDLMFSTQSVGGGGVSFGYALGLIFLMLWAQTYFKGLLSSAVLILGMSLGAAFYFVLDLNAQPMVMADLGAVGLPSLWPGGLELQPGVIAAFVLCYLAVMSNELATVEAVGDMTKSPAMGPRQNRAVAVTGIFGMLAGLWGVPGPVTYSVSPGVLVSTKSASRWTLLPAAVAVLLLAFFPGALGLFYLVPQPVVGAVLFFLMANTVYAAIRLLVSGQRDFKWSDGVVVGGAMTVGLVVAFMPPEVKAALPPLIKPILANGFVMGLAVALLLEHVLLRRR
jgi:xanthine/uracil permease